MIDVKFLQDYRGELTGEQYYTAGTVAAFPDGQAAALVAAGRAEKSGEPATEPETEQAEATQERYPWADVKWVGPQIENALWYLGLNTKADLQVYIAQHGRAGLEAIPSISTRAADSLIAFAESA